MQITAHTFTTSLLMIFALLVVYARMRNWTESNVPLIFYGVMIAYVHAYADDIPALPLYVGLALTLLLRFEFMARGLALLVKFAELCAIGLILYNCYRSIMA
jgi:hypothetical protein